MCKYQSILRTMSSFSSSWCRFLGTVLDSGAPADVTDVTSRLKLVADKVQSIGGGNESPERQQSHQWERAWIPGWGCGSWETQRQLRPVWEISICCMRAPETFSILLPQPTFLVMTNARFKSYINLCHPRRQFNSLKAESRSTFFNICFLMGHIIF